jgi:diguanylate cyclase (GGDEF)-like protein
MLLLGLAMMTTPISVGIWQLLGHRTDPVLVMVASIAIVPLVMFRIHGLVSQRAVAEAALAHQAMHDSLTGLPNRAQFVALLHPALTRLRAGRSTEIAVLFCDLDGFKHINDTLGHAAGDHLLVAVAQRLQDCLRGNDVVSRFGGDEFLILCESDTETHIGDRLSARITTELRRPITLGATKVTIGASIGIAATTTMGDLTAEEIIRDADLAMYAAKQTGTRPARLGARPDERAKVAFPATALP